MVERTKGRKQYRTMRGTVIDMDMLRKKNELTPAVGNMKVNVRGDELGEGGKIIRTREQVLTEYYKNNDAVVADPGRKQMTDVEQEEFIISKAKEESDKKGQSTKKVQLDDLELNALDKEFNGEDEE